MLLSDNDIKKEVKEGRIRIDNFDLKRLQPASYDILLGNKFILTETYQNQFIDPVKKIFPNTREVIIKDGESFVLHPRISVLGTSWDYFGSKDYLIQLSGKSSLARIGLLVHNAAGIVNPGHYLNITLELCNLGSVPIVLRPKMPIAQLLFSRLMSPVKSDYNKTGRYSKDNWDNFVPSRANTKKPKNKK